MNEADDIQRGERIDAYVSGKLDGVERAAFEEDMARDADLFADVELARLLRETVKNEDVMCLRDRVREVTEDGEARAEHGGGTPVVPIQRSRTWAYLAAAASVALVVTFALWHWGGQPDYGELAMSYTRGSEPTTRGDSTDVLSGDALLLKEARERLLDKKPTDALALLQTGTMFDACKEADRVWLMALAHLMRNNVEMARSELQRVARSGCEVKSRAEELLDEL